MNEGPEGLTSPALSSGHGHLPHVDERGASSLCRCFPDRVNSPSPSLAPSCSFRPHAISIWRIVAKAGSRLDRL